MTAGYELTATAEKDLEEILLYVAERDGGKRALGVHGRFERLGAMPEIGSLRPSLSGERRVIHGARDLGRILGSGL